ncbi:MAG TPA: HAMP domain-containing sensor histidine kinase [Lutibacter sp.]|nr:HAMP domain-containing sensor histidine kinase [Lutibacter sp.]
MRYQDKTKEQLLDDLGQFEYKIQELKSAENNQKKIIESLHLERDLYADLANALPSGIYRLRVFKELSLIEDKWLSSKDIPYVFEFANDRFFEILNLDRLDFERNPGIINDLIFEADKAKFARINVESNLNTTPFSWEGRFLINNKVIWIHFKSIPRVLENSDIIWTGTLEDITKRKQTEEEIKLKNDELQKLNADKDIFMSILAHDLISPFNLILGYLDLLANNLRKYEMDVIEKQISIVNNTALNAFCLLEDILMWARSQSGKLAFEPRECNFKISCDKVVEILKPNANAKSITINVIETEKIIVFADSNMLNIILRNLISNAIKFTNHSGIINIYAAQHASGVIISVSDNGIGIAPEILSKLFNITQMYSTKGTANEKGTGFGLLLCKEFVEKHGGKIWVESELGKGSEFKFELPLNSELSSSI